MPQQRAEATVTPSGHVWMSEGHRLLSQVHGSLTDIQHRLGYACSRQAIQTWRNGTTPSDAHRAQLYAVFGIPPDAWSQRSKVADFPVPEPPLKLPEPAPTAPPPEPAAPGLESVRVGGTSLEDCIELLTIIKRERSVPSLLPSERVKLADAEARLIRLRAALEAKQELSEDRYVREHPAWLRARNVIAQALKAHPAAAAAVADALERLGL